MPNAKRQQLSASGETPSTNKPKAGKAKPAPKEPMKVQRLDSPIKAGD